MPPSTPPLPLDLVRREVGTFIQSLAAGGQEPNGRDKLLRRVLTAQRAHVAPYAKFLKGVPSAQDPLDWPALPTDVFRYTRVAAFAAEEQRGVFRTSGSTQQRRGEHPYRDLGLYDVAARSAAAYALCMEAPMSLVSLCPPFEDKPDSSLSYMFDRFASWFSPSKECSYVTAAPDGTHHDALRKALKRAEQPVGLLGTSFHFAFAEEGLGAEYFVLPEGSWLLHTGGFKGHKTQFAPEELEQRLHQRYGLPRHRIFCEYGMTELSSQLYQLRLRHQDTRQSYWAPGWVRATVVDPETGRAAPIGTEGLLRLDDLANVDTVAAIQTSDLAVKETNGEVRLLGRAPDAALRGCSLAAEEWYEDR